MIRYTLVLLLPVLGALAHPAPREVDSIVPGPTPIRPPICLQTICPPCPPGATPTSIAPPGKCPICSCAPTSTKPIITSLPTTKPPIVIPRPTITLHRREEDKPTKECPVRPCGCPVGQEPITTPDADGCLGCGCQSVTAPIPTITIPRPTATHPIITSPIIPPGCPKDPCSTWVCIPWDYPTVTHVPGEKCPRCVCVRDPNYPTPIPIPTATAL
ncbi:hypothetical protein CC1G_11775 [Coprinopsis cinerea okayama7|uniref:Uncharacterized protein n=1 Tax=Coprinopsis cinerea (strain Okayama-7 / 130 / ATCC MYA-4618 / FGSC 9003) TaxID=240176 RepID=A8NPI2_COPC7|nr:hypothetical protein CC1G_11775 [Coprinopsis cinerea okayama7\|eukprot:XP_001835341.1 hypothetical protein CC1G_11775 [Coprinopsis cinerea okayama7\